MRMPRSIETDGEKKESYETERPLIFATPLLRDTLAQNPIGTIYSTKNYIPFLVKNTVLNAFTSHLFLCSLKKRKRG